MSPCLFRRAGESGSAHSLPLLPQGGRHLRDVRGVPGHRLPVGYVDAIGSRRSHRERICLLRETDLPEEQLALLRSPIGLDLGAHVPAETAASITAVVSPTSIAPAVSPLATPGGHTPESSRVTHGHPVLGTPNDLSTRKIEHVLPCLQQHDDGLALACSDLYDELVAERDELLARIDTLRAPADAPQTVIAASPGGPPL
ncbi:XdhC family protein [Streptomyces sp. NPDC057682]|uniref:XdhC family protein n=1 Tax=Streptomyces sp. NPDC057682 TaxID=3346210 RepID=UPI00368BA0F3